jgi:hypothetical protein
MGYYQREKAVAKVHCWDSDPRTWKPNRVQSAAYQKDRAHRRAFLNWEKDYWLAHAHNDLQVDVTGLSLDGAAYQYAISQPPSEKNHPLWSAATAMEKDERGRKTRRPLFSRRTTSTTLQLAVDHAFTGSYAKRFRPLDPPSSLRCPCGHPVTDLQGPPSERTQTEKIQDLKSLARQYARDQGSCDDTRISYLEFVESEAKADWTLARMIAG